MLQIVFQKYCFEIFGFVMNLLEILVFSQTHSQIREFFRLNTSTVSTAMKARYLS